MCNHPPTYRTRLIEALGPPPFTVDTANGVIGVISDGEDRLIGFNTTAPTVDGQEFSGPVLRRAPDGTWTLETLGQQGSTSSALQMVPAVGPFLQRVFHSGSGLTAGSSRVNEYVDGVWVHRGAPAISGPYAIEHFHLDPSTPTFCLLGLGSNSGNIRYSTGTGFPNLGASANGRPSSAVWWNGSLYVAGGSDTPFNTLGRWDSATSAWEQIITADALPPASTSRRPHVGRLDDKLVVILPAMNLDDAEIFGVPIPPTTSPIMIVWDGETWEQVQMPAILGTETEVYHIQSLHVFGKDRLIFRPSTIIGAPGVWVYTDGEGFSEWWPFEASAMLFASSGNIQEGGPLSFTVPFGADPPTGIPWLEQPADTLLHFDVELLPKTLAGPIEKQVRVFFNDVEGERGEDWEYEDGFIEWLAGADFGDRITAFRETRWDKSWVTFNRTGLIRRNSDLRNFYKQRLFILQEVCDTVAISHLIGAPIILPPYVPDTTRPGTQVWTGGADNPIPLEIELLPYSIAGSLQHQIVVQGMMEEGGLLITIPYQDSDPAADEWTEVDGEIVFGPDSVWGSEEWPIVIRRCTKADALWHKFQDAATFSSTEVRNVQKQIRFLMEEDWCPLVLLPPGHPLGNHIFPRPLNFITFQGPGNIFSFAQFQWLPGDFQLFINDLPVDDFDIDFFNWEVTTPPLDFGDIGSFGPAGGPFSNPGISPTGGIGSQGDSSDEDEDEDEESSTPIHGPDGTDWPPPPPNPPGFFIPFWWDYSIPTSTPPFGNDSPGQFGPTGYLQSISFGFKFVEFPTQDFPTGQVFIGLGRIQTAHIIGDPPPNGVGTWACLWSYSGAGDQAILNHSHTLAASVPVVRPGWAIAIANWYANNLPVGHPLRVLAVAAGSNPAGDEEEQTYGNPIAQAALEFVNQFPPGTDTTQEQFMDYMAGGGGFPSE